MESAGERAMQYQLRVMNMEHGSEREYVFAPPRRWRFDFAYPAHRIAIEVEGGQWTGGHRRGRQFDAEAEKYNEAALLGWVVIRVTPGMIEDGRAIDVIGRALRQAVEGGTVAAGSRRRVHAEDARSRGGRTVP